MGGFQQLDAAAGQAHRELDSLEDVLVQDAAVLLHHQDEHLAGSLDSDAVVLRRYVERLVDCPELEAVELLHHQDERLVDCPDSALGLAVGAAL